MIQSRVELDAFYSNSDPWNYENNPEDLKRREILISELPSTEFRNVLDIGCGNGFVTRELPGLNITGIDISAKAIDFANLKTSEKKIKYWESDFFEFPKKYQGEPFDLIIITGLLYPQYIGNSLPLVYSIINDLLVDGGLLVSVHINDWSVSKFPFLLSDYFFYDYRNYIHRFEKYYK
jgi:predicted TPR repeat methyltransferase